MQVKYIILAVTGFCVYTFTNAGLEYGPFDLVVTNFTQCKGPKRRDCCDMYATISGLHKVQIELRIKENVKTTKGKIVATAQGKDSVRLQLKNPCEHLFMRPLFQTLLNVTKDCIILKGDYHIMLDVLEVTDRYYSGGFIYGRWKFMSVMFNDYCNFACTNLFVDIIPKKSKNKTLSHSSK